MFWWVSQYSILEASRVRKLNMEGRNTDMTLNIISSDFFYSSNKNILKQTHKKCKDSSKRQQNTIWRCSSRYSLSGMQCTRWSINTHFTPSIDKKHLFTFMCPLLFVPRKHFSIREHLAATAFSTMQRLTCRWLLVVWCLLLLRDGQQFDVPNINNPFSITFTKGFV